MVLEAVFVVGIQLQSFYLKVVHRQVCIAPVPMVCQSNSGASMLDGHLLAHNGTD